MQKNGPVRVRLTLLFLGAPLPYPFAFVLEKTCSSDHICARACIVGQASRGTLQRLLLAGLAVVTLSLVVVLIKSGSVAMELTSEHAMALAEGIESNTERNAIAAGGTRLLDAVHDSVENAGVRHNEMPEISKRVAEGGDNLKDITAAQRTADIAAAQEALKNYLLQSSVLQTANTAVVDTHSQVAKDPQAHALDLQRAIARQKTRLRVKKTNSHPRPRPSKGPYRGEKLDRQAVQAFLESNGNTKRARAALSTARYHMGDVEVTGGDDLVSTYNDNQHPKEAGIRDLLKGVSGQPGW